MTSNIEATAAAYARHRAVHESREWSSFAPLYAEQARYYDPFYGWMEGRQAIDEFFERSLSGLEDWSFPMRWHVVGEGRVVAHWLNRLPGQRPDGSPYEFPGYSIIHFGADGLIVEQQDCYDRFTALRVIAAARTGALGRAVGWGWDLVANGVLRLAHRAVVRTERH